MRRLPGWGRGWSERRAVLALFALNAGIVAFELFEPAQKGAFSGSFVAQGERVFVILIFRPVAEIHVLFVFDFVETALVAQEEPLGVRGFVHE